MMVFIRKSSRLLLGARLLISLFLVINVISDFSVIGKEHYVSQTKELSLSAGKDANPGNRTSIISEDYALIESGTGRSFLITIALFIFKAIKLACICTFFLILFCLISPLIPLILPLFLFSLLFGFLLIGVIAVTRPPLPPPPGDDDDDFQVVTTRSIMFE